jgi:hypothetical protein
VAYLGNNLQVANTTYRVIDDISSGFNGSTTSFALKVQGLTPVPFPVNEQNCLISVGGVPQKPDYTGTEGFKFSGSNIVFSSAPAAGEKFWGVILAGADYVAAGVTYPNGTANTPSITFGSNTSTGLFLSSTNVLGIATGGVQAVTIDSAQRVGIGTTSPVGLIDVRTPTTRTNGGGLVGQRSFYIGSDENIYAGVVGTSGTNGWVNSPYFYLTGLGYNTSWGTQPLGLRISSQGGSYSSGTGNTTGVSTIFEQASSSGSPSPTWTEQMRLDSSGNLKFNSGYGSAATAYGCRAWVNFDGTTASPSTIRASGNVSSVTKNGTGDYTVNFTTAMPDANYAVSCSANRNGTTNDPNWTTNLYGASPIATGSVRINMGVPVSYANVDSPFATVAIFR